MRILIFSWRGPKHPNAGGAEIVTFEYAKGWVKSGHSVTLFTSYFKRAKKFELIEGVNIIRQGNQFFEVQIRAFWWYLFENHIKYNLIIDEFHGIPFFTPIYIGIKKLGFIHEVAKNIWFLNPWPRPWNLIPALIGTIFEPFIFKLIYKNIPFLTISKSTMSDLTNWGIPKRNITVINNGVNVLVPNHRIRKEGKITITFLGALAKDKGVEDTLKVFEILSKEESFKFWIIGNGEKKYFEFLKKMTKNFNLTNRIKFWGFVEEEKKFELLKRAHILINPSKREGWGLVVIEAAAMGTPCVGYNVVGLKDSVKNDITGILCKQDPKILAKEIWRLIHDTKKLNTFSKNCIAWSKNFSWDSSIKKSLKLIENI